MKLHYFKSPKGIRNFGDDLNTWLWDKLLPGIFDEDHETIFIGLGTLLNRRLPPRSRTVVFGSGVGYGIAPKVDDSWRIYCVRGPLSARALGISEAFAVTDGAALIRKLFTVNGRKKYQFSYMPHFSNTPGGSNSLKAVCDHLGFGYIDPRWSIEGVLSSIGEAECLITESMHGAIVADCFRVPWIPVKTSSHILDFKWQDWCSSIGVTYEPRGLMPICDVDAHSDVFALARHWAKMRMAGTQLKRIAKRSHRYLSEEDLLERLTLELEERCQQLKQDVKAGVFTAKTETFSNVSVRVKGAKCKTSVLIITKNRSFVLGDCLSKIHPQIEASKHEVVVVDSSEDDQTEKLVKQFPWVNYHRIQLPPGTRPQVYSYGAKVSRGEIIALLDDDSMVYPGWLDALEACYEDFNVGAARGRVLSPVPKSTVTSYEPGMLFGCNMSIRKSILERIHYFDSRFTGQNIRVEDDVCMWAKRLGYKVIFEPKATVLHLAVKRPDIARSNLNLKAEFFARRDTVWFYMKHFKFSPSMLLHVTLRVPLIRAARHILGGNLRKPRLTMNSFHYILPAAAGLLGALWGAIVTCFYCVKDAAGSQKSSVRKLDGKDLGTRLLCYVGSGFMNLLLLDRGISQTRRSGKIVLVENTIRELSKFHNLHYVYMPEQDEKYYANDFINKFTKTLDVMDLTSEISFWRRILSAICLDPWFVLKRRCPKSWAKAREGIRNLCVKYKIDAIVPFSYQAAQFVFDLGLPVVNHHGDPKLVRVERERKNMRLSIAWAKAIFDELRVKRYEHWVLKKSDMNIFLSEEDSQFHLNNGIKGKVWSEPRELDTEV